MTSLTHELAMAARAESIPASHLGSPIPQWSESAKEYMVMERFPQLRRRLETGPDAFDPEERTKLR